MGTHRVFLALVWLGVFSVSAASPRSHSPQLALLLSDNPIFESAGRGIDLTPVINQVLDASATQITDICETTVGNGKALVLPNAVMANASGCAYAGRLKWPDAEVVIGLDPGFGGFKVTALRRCEEAQ